MRKTRRNVVLLFFLLLTILLLLVVLLPTIKSKKIPILSGIPSQSRNSYWIQTENGWEAKGTPPQCPNPEEFAPITDVSKATSVLYPGQMRSVGYEPTAGFRFDGLPNDAVNVYSSIDGDVIQAARFLIGNEMQYVFDILSPCGIMVRFDHLLTLTPKFQEIANNLPEPRENDSRSTTVNPPVNVTKGEHIATAVGIRRNNNTFISWTMYDFNKKNKISQDPTWAANHSPLDHYVICPFPYLPKDDQVRINALPAADSISGNKSDFCD